MPYLPKSSELTFCPLTASSVQGIREKMMFLGWFCLLWRQENSQLRISLAGAWVMAEALLLPSLSVPKGISIRAI
jgi:hypothetical protein